MSLKSHLKHRFNPKTIFKEVYSHITDRFIPHGANEVANALYHGSAYWPTAGVSTVAPPEEESWEKAAEAASHQHPEPNEGRSR